MGPGPAYHVRMGPQCPWGSLVPHHFFQISSTVSSGIQSFFLTLMGFNHPHMQRLQIALQQLLSF